MNVLNDWPGTALLVCQPDHVSQRGVRVYAADHACMFTYIKLILY